MVSTTIRWSGGAWWSLLRYGIRLTQSLNSMLAIREVNKWPNKYNYTNVLKENLPYIPQKNRRDMTKTWTYPKQWTPRSSSDGQRYSRTELRVLLFLYCTVIFMHSKLDSKEPIPLQTTQLCFTLGLNWKSGLC